jgi:CBS domain-containing protein
MAWPNLRAAMPLTVMVRDVMDKRVVPVIYMATVDEAVKKMLENNVWSLVVERKGAPWGVVTERDVIRRCVAKGLSTAKTSVGSISTSPIITISPDATMREAMDAMAAREIRRLFVVEKGKIIGRITQTEVFQSTIDVMETLTSLSNVQ